MKLTLLLDMDDTLLANSIDTFVPAYLQLLSRHVGPLAGGNELPKHLLKATQAMLVKRAPGETLESVFDRAFYPPMGTSKAALREPIERFYAEVYPSLRSLTQTRPAAHRLVEDALQAGIDLVVATNPLFPRTAILQRLQWAGFTPEPFRLISSYESFHFAKPNPAYYAEILAQLGWPNQPAAMVGNSLEDDILPASALGMPCYWLTDRPPDELPAGLHPLSAAGTMDGLFAWLKTVAEQQSNLPVDTLTALLAVLRSTPAALDTLTANLEPDTWRFRPAADEWNLTEIVTHLRDVDREVNLPRFRRVISQEMAHVAGINTDLWAKERNYSAEDGPEMLRELIAVRTEMIDLLDALSSADWERKAQHTIFGPTSLRELVGFVATHDRSHVQQAFANLRAAES